MFREAANCLSCIKILFFDSLGIRILKYLGASKPCVPLTCKWLRKVGGGYFQFRWMGLFVGDRDSEVISDNRERGVS